MNHSDMIKGEIMNWQYSQSRPRVALCDSPAHANQIHYQIRPAAHDPLGFGAVNAAASCVLLPFRRPAPTIGVVTEERLKPLPSQEPWPRPLPPFAVPIHSNGSQFMMERSHEQQQLMRRPAAIIHCCRRLSSFYGESHRPGLTALQRFL